jgi:hypothetical protein
MISPKQFNQHSTYLTDSKSHSGFGVYHKQFLLTPEMHHQSKHQPAICLHSEPLRPKGPG